MAPRALFTGGAHVERRTIRRSGGLVGQVITLGGLSATLTDVLARIEDAAGVAQTERLTPRSGGWPRSGTRCVRQGRT